MEVLEDRCLLSTFTVLNTNDEGPDSLRQAILDANANPGTDSIAFNIPGAGPHTIAPLSALPVISAAAVTIDGYTQPGASPNTLAMGINAVMKIILDGSNAGPANGLEITTSNCNIRGLVIHRFGGDGILVWSGAGTGNSFEGNFIGTDVTGTLALGNGRAGLHLRTHARFNRIGGTSPAARNLISGNRGIGASPNGGGILMQLFADRATVQGNYIGTDVTGRLPLGNASDGITMWDPASHIIGGTMPGAANVISGNGGSGIHMNQGAAGGVWVQGNFIGTDVTGTIAVPNAVNGVTFIGRNIPSDFSNLIGGMVPGAGNVISGNRGSGIHIGIGDTIDVGSLPATLIQGNLIGTRGDGISPLGNGRHGVVLLSRTRNTIGGTDSGAGNVIAYNNGDGVFVEANIRHTIQGNAIFANAGLGIDLGPNGVNPNDTGDSDSGPNNLQNYPVLTSVTSASGNTTVAGTLNSAPNTTFRLEFFATAECDPSGFGEGERFLGSTTAMTDSSGNASFTLVLPVEVTPNHYLTATATDPNGNTSEFSSCLAVGVPSLRVTSLTPTSTGFTAQFSRPIDPSVLNLYDTQANPFGLPDVQLIGAANGLIRGSLVIEGATRVTFVRTDGLLPADTYTVTFRSAANGFRTSDGLLLDGNSDGTPGDDYAGTFTVAPPPAVSVIMSDIMRGPGQPFNLPATALRLTNGEGVTHVRFTLRYDPALLTLSAVATGDGLPGGTAATVTSPSLGMAEITITSPVPLEAIPYEIVLMGITVPDTAPYGAKQVLDLVGLQLNGGTIPVADDDGVHIVGYFGDVTGNGGYSAADATRVLRVAVGLDSGFAAYPLADPLLIADITANGTLNSTDATRILQQALGIDQELIPPLPPNPPTIVPGGPDPVLQFPRELRGRPGELVRVPLHLDRSDGLESADLAIAYDTQRLEVIVVNRGRLTQDFNLFAVNLDREGGTITVGLGRSQGPISDLGSGSVIEIVFRIRRDATAGTAMVNLMQGLGPTRTQLNEGGLDLIPDPSNEAGDVLDGIITVSRRKNRTARTAK